MSISQDLLDIGLATDLNNGKHEVNIPLHIPAVAIDSNGFEYFAKEFRWEAIEDSLEYIDAEEDLPGSYDVDAKYLSIVQALEAIYGVTLTPPATKIDTREKKLAYANFLSQILKGVNVIRNFAWDVLATALVKDATEQAKEAAEAQVNAMKSI